jgi:hypothetical protein
VNAKVVVLEVVPHYSPQNQMLAKGVTGMAAEADMSRAHTH